MFVVIDKVSWKLNQSTFSSSTEGHATIRMWLMDVKTGQPVVSDGRFEGKYNRELGFVNGSNQIRHACARAVDNALNAFLKPYRIEKKR